MRAGLGLTPRERQILEAGHGGDWPFAVGDRVVLRDDALLDRPARLWHLAGEVLTVVKVSDRGRWIAVARESGERYPMGTPGMGPGYFRIVGACGGHRPAFRDGPCGDGYYCSRCDEPLPEAVTRWPLYGIGDPRSHAPRFPG